MCVYICVCVSAGAQRVQGSKQFRAYRRVVL
jgi:hypothetical protein